MRGDIRDAIENARTVEGASRNVLIHRAEPQRRRSFGDVRAVVLAVAQELPSDMTMAELCDELAIANNQVG